MKITKTWEHAVLVSARIPRSALRIPNLFKGGLFYDSEPFGVVFYSDGRNRGIVLKDDEGPRRGGVFQHGLFLLGPDHGLKIVAHVVGFPEMSTGGHHVRAIDQHALGSLDAQVLKAHGVAVGNDHVEIGEKRAVAFNQL